jgi:hypothetical protein
MQHSSTFQTEPFAERATMLNGITLIALGLSIFFLNLWDNAFVRTGVCFFWGGYFLISHGPALIRTIRSLEKSHE